MERGFEKEIQRQSSCICWLAPHMPAMVRLCQPVAAVHRLSPAAVFGCLRPKHLSRQHYLPVCALAGNGGQDLNHGLNLGLLFWVS